MDPIGGIGFLCERLVDVLLYKIGPKNGHVGIPSQLLIDMQDDVAPKVMQDVIFHVLAERVVVEYVGFAGQGGAGASFVVVVPNSCSISGGYWGGISKIWPAGRIRSEAVRARFGWRSGCKTVFGSISCNARFRRVLFYSVIVSTFLYNRSKEKGLYTATGILA